MRQAQAEELRALWPAGVHDTAAGPGARLPGARSYPGAGQSDPPVDPGLNLSVVVDCADVVNRAVSRIFP